MEIITVNQENIEQEHICCAMSKGATNKKEWLKERFKDGLVFKRIDAKAKVFIEYIPTNKAWCPINGDTYMHINCFWVSGKYKGQGFSNQLLEHCINDAKQLGMVGITVLSSKKKKPFLSEGSYLEYKGFKIADSAYPFFELYYLPFTNDAPVPTFKECAKKGMIEDEGMVLYYSDQCPFTNQYVSIVDALAKTYGTSITLHKIETVEQAKQCPSAVTTYSFFHHGRFVTNEIFSAKKFEKYLIEQGFSKI